MEYEIEGSKGRWLVEETGEQLRLNRDETQHVAAVLSQAGSAVILVDNRPHEVFSHQGMMHTASVTTFVRDTRDLRREKLATTYPTSTGTVVSPMPGRVLRFCVEPNASVAAGAPLAVIEAMKMENELVSPCDGVVAELLAKEGEAVEQGAPLVQINCNSVD